MPVLVVSDAILGVDFSWELTTFDDPFDNSDGISIAKDERFLHE